jgi:hypothetical protein
MGLEIDRTGALTDELINQVRGGNVHVVCCAEDGPSTFTRLMETVSALSEAERARLCNRINREDEPGTLWPVLNLTGLPKRLLHQENVDGEDLRRCLRDAFTANRDFCRCPTLLFDLRGAAANQAMIVEEIRRMYQEWFDRPPIVRLVISS